MTADEIRNLQASTIRKDVVSKVIENCERLVKETASNGGVRFIHKWWSDVSCNCWKHECPCPSKIEIEEVLKYFEQNGFEANCPKHSSIRIAW
ncbi:hypothetical protein SAMN04487977_101525 [Treponema bryantii]|uniref:Uncharacterized protein n=1 Tax=Treponema bryantii TaxID=163 RepID=A0A1H9B1L7_9SPIR|nr:hypothetical protein [Treponema bryantii]SEP82118.1 hypothetical protein SAMN04487977_101525 [Treponema bryantii]